MEYEEEISLQDPVQLLRRGLVFALAVALGAAGLTYYLSRRMTPEYDSTATLLVSRPGSAQGTFGVSLVTAPTIDITAYQAAAKSYPVLSTALETLGVHDAGVATVGAFSKVVSVRAESAQQSSLLRVTVRDADPSWAAEAANALGNALLGWDIARAKQNLQVLIATLQSQIDAFDAEIVGASTGVGSDASQSTQVEGIKALRADRANQLNAVRALSASAVGLLEVLEPAMPALRPSRPQPARNAALAFSLGLFLVYGLVMLREAMNTRFRNSEDIQRATELPVLGEFPRLPSGTTRLPSEATGYLRTNIMFATSQDLPKVIVVTSPGPAEGKSTVAMGLAQSLARNDYNTLLIDADMRKPTVSARAGLTKDQVGNSVLRAFLENPDGSGRPVTVHLDGVSLDVLPTLEPAPDPTELLSRSFATLLMRLKGQYDAIVIDSPPTLPVADTLTIAPHATAVVLALSLPTTDRRSTAATLDLYERIGVRVLGTVITNVDHGGRAARVGKYGYGYGYGYC